MIVCLVAAPSRFSFKGNICENHGLMYLKSALEKCRGVSVTVVNGDMEGLGEEEIVARVLVIKPDIIAFSLSQDNLETTGILARRIKRFGSCVHITCGGHFATVNYKVLLTWGRDAIDSVIVGDGECSIRQLVSLLNRNKDWKNTKGIAYEYAGGIIYNAEDELDFDLDKLPFSDREDTTRILTVGGECEIVSSRGCIHFCKHCTVPLYNKICGYPNIRFRSIKSICDEMEMLLRDYNIRRIHLIDNDFFIYPNRGSELKEEIVKRGLEVRLGISTTLWTIDMDEIKLLSEVGLYKLSFELNFMNEDANLSNIISRVMNEIQNYGIKMKWYFRMFYPGISVERFKMQLNLLRKYGLQQNLYYITSELPLYPDTPLYEEVKQFAYQKKPGLFYFKYNEEISRIKSSIRCFYYNIFHGFQNKVIVLENRLKADLRSGNDKRYELIPSIDAGITDISTNLNKLFIDVCGEIISRVEKYKDMSTEVLYMEILEAKKPEFDQWNASLDLIIK